MVDGAQHESCSCFHQYQLSSHQQQKFYIHHFCKILAWCTLGFNICSLKNNLWFCHRSSLFWGALIALSVTPTSVQRHFLLSHDIKSLSFTFFCSFTKILFSFFPLYRFGFSWSLNWHIACKESWQHCAGGIKHTCGRVHHFQMMHFNNCLLTFTCSGRSGFWLVCSSGWYILPVIGLVICVMNTNELLHFQASGFRTQKPVCGQYYHHCHHLFGQHLVTIYLLRWLKVSIRGSYNQKPLHSCRLHSAIPPQQILHALCPHIKCLVYTYIRTLVTTI